MAINDSPYLRSNWKFPTDDENLKIQLERSYLDIANTVNARTIGSYPTNVQAITGNKFYLKGNQPQQGFRQVYSLSGTTSIDHNVKLTDIAGFTDAYGVFTDGTNWYGLMPGTNTAIAGQISFYISPTQIVFQSGAGAPTLTSGTIVLEWISFP